MEKRHFKEGPKITVNYSPPSNSSLLACLPDRVSVVLGAEFKYQTTSQPSNNINNQARQTTSPEIAIEISLLCCLHSYRVMQMMANDDVDDNSLSKHHYNVFSNLNSLALLLCRINVIIIENVVISNELFFVLELER